MNKETIIAWVGFLALGSFALTVGSCISITGESHEPDYFVLEAISGDRPAEADFLEGGSFHLGQTEIPAYLEGTRIVTRTSGNQLSYAEFHRWGETLDLGVTRVVASDLASTLGSLNYSNYPNRTRPNNRYEISITVQRFERLSSGKVTFEGSWRLVRDREQVLVVSVKETSSAAGFGHGATVKAMSATLRRISDRIAVRFLKYLEEESASVEP